jgi:tetratricopeptide (TPR) repeat protein
MKTSLLLMVGLFLIFESFATSAENKETLTQLLHENLNLRSDLALKYAQQLEEIAEKGQDTVYWRYALNCQGIIYNRSLNYAAALRVLEKAYSLDQTNFYVLMDLAKTHRFAGGEEKALFFYQKALEADTTKKSFIVSNLGLLNLRQKRFDEAKSYFYEELSLAAGIQDSINAYLDLSFYHLEVGEYDKTKYYLTQTDEILSSFLKERSSRKQFILAILYSNWGQYHLKQKDALQAEEYFNKALEIAERLNLGLVLEECYKGLQMVSTYKQDVEMTEHYWQKYKDFTLENSKQLAAYYEYSVAKKEKTLAATNLETSKWFEYFLIALSSLVATLILFFGSGILFRRKLKKMKATIKRKEAKVNELNIANTRLETQMLERFSKDEE